MKGGGDRGKEAGPGGQRTAKSGEGAEAELLQLKIVDSISRLLSYQ